MPELPEVESARRLVEKHLLNIPIKSVILREQGGGPRDGLIDDIIMPLPDAEDNWVSTLVGKTIIAARRKGKQLFFEVGGSSGSSKSGGKSRKKDLNSSTPTGQLHLLFHFGMTGSFAIEGMEVGTYKSFKVDPIYPPRFTKFEVVFENGQKLSFADPRRLGRIKLLSGNPLEQPPLNKLAIDPLVEKVDKSYFIDRVKSSKGDIKTALLNQEAIIAGIGNYLADEVCYQSKISPKSMCSSLPDDKIAELLTVINDVLSVACDHNERNVEFPEHWLFHQRWSKGKGGVKMPSGASVAFDNVGGRTTAIVAAVQIMYSKTSDAGKKRKVAKGDDVEKKIGGVKRKAAGK